MIARTACVAGTLLDALADSPMSTDMADVSHPTIDSALDDCIAECRNCHEICMRFAMTHCLEMGGDHVDPQHFRLMIACAQQCQATANVMLCHTSLHGQVCAACAELCGACATTCERLGTMAECAEACRRCASTCRSMAD